MPHKNKRTIRFIVIFPFIFPLVLAVLLTLYTVVKFEINAWHAALPENEAYTEIGQWSPYVVAFIVFFATLTARIKGWDFDSKDTDSEKRVFGWLLTESGESDESEGLLEHSPSILLPVIAGTGEPIHLDV
jgi:hypothetical protein